MTRTLFPVPAGFLRFGFVNNTDAGTGEFSVGFYLLESPWHGHEAIKPRLATRMQLWEGFTSGMTCTVSYDTTNRPEDPNNATEIASLKGYNVTVAALIRDNCGGAEVFGEVHQVNCGPYLVTSLIIN